jgi:hypothetical protein
MSVAYNKAILYTELKQSGVISAGDMTQVTDSLKQNGLAVVRNFLPSDKIRKIRRAAEISCDTGYGIGGGYTLDPSQNEKMHEFRHPYLTSPEAVEYVTSENLLRPIDALLGERAIIHHAVYQISLPSQERVLDFHIDSGSFKSINGRKKFSDLRIRTILYLSDVKNGGFSYILNSHDAALRTFLPLPTGELFPQSEVPRGDPERIVTIHEPAGTIIFFNTHGLHRPELLDEKRVVLNTWFCRNDFLGKLPAMLFSAAAIPTAQKHRIHIFENERNCPIEEYSHSFAYKGWRKYLRSLVAALKFEKPAKGYE